MTAGTYFTSPPFVIPLTVEISEAGWYAGHLNPVFIDLQRYDGVEVGGIPSRMLAFGWPENVRGNDGPVPVAGLTPETALDLLADPYVCEAPEVEALMRITDAKLRLIEVPVHMRRREHGESSFRGRRAVVPSWVVPGSGLVKKQAEAEGLHTVFRDAGLEWREPGCSMCVGMNGDTGLPGQRIASTSNRNFMGRQGRGVRTHLLSPAMAAAAAVTGRFTDVRRLAPQGA